MSINILAENILLASMTPADFAAVTANARIIELPLNLELALPGHGLDHCWFPLSGMVSVIAADADYRQAEIGLFGREGMGEVGSLLGDSIAGTRLLVQVPGEALRVRSSDLHRAMVDSTHLQQLLLAYARAFQVQVSSSALAFAAYTIEKRLARWLLMTSDRAGLPSLPLTHQMLSNMLGVRRAGITGALGRLAEMGAIIKGRSHIAILARSKLLHIAGGGYGEPEAAYQRLVSTTWLAPVIEGPRSARR